MKDYIARREYYLKSLGTRKPPPAGSAREKAVKAGVTPPDYGAGKPRILGKIDKHSPGALFDQPIKALQRGRKAGKKALSKTWKTFKKYHPGLAVYKKLFGGP